MDVERKYYPLQEHGSMEKKPVITDCPF